MNATSERRRSDRRRRALSNQVHRPRRITSTSNEGRHATESVAPSGQKLPRRTDFWPPRRNDRFAGSFSSAYERIHTMLRKNLRHLCHLQTWSITRKGPAEATGTHRTLGGYQHRYYGTIRHHGSRKPVHHNSDRPVLQMDRGKDHRHLSDRRRGEIPGGRRLQWDTALPQILQQLRSRKNAATGFMPHEALFGRDIQRPGD